ncbi:hypothetical protein EVAR_85454_1 [Eumeta japonica]|uniref:Uncharacterized protein n=1 Tax=Eumeta variegata TaxID=151549 RepID=A0A4C1WJ30_EUMVA|nr:hypothetical protein EVAR_85454_1 [Eumeta japonica]
MQIRLDVRVTRAAAAPPTPDPGDRLQNVAPAQSRRRVLRYKMYIIRKVFTIRAPASRRRRPTRPLCPGADYNFDEQIFVDCVFLPPVRKV